MSDLIQDSLRDVIDKLADIEAEEPCCPMAAQDAYDAMDKEPAFQIYTLKQIATNQHEPWAAQVALNWLRDNNQL